MPFDIQVLAMAAFAPEQRRNVVKFNVPANRQQIGRQVMMRETTQIAVQPDKQVVLNRPPEREAVLFAIGVLHQSRAIMPRINLLSPL
jgi:hypothetical protein